MTPEPPGMPFCVHCGKNIEQSSARTCPHCGKAGEPNRSPLSAAVLAFGLVGFFVAAGALMVHLKKTPVTPTPAVTTKAPASASATPVVTPTTTPAVASATPGQNLFVGTWTGEPTEKGDQITVVVEGDTAHYEVAMKDGGDYRRGNLKVIPNAKHPTDQIDGIAGTEAYMRVGVDNGEMYGWVEVIRRTMDANGELKNSEPEQPEFANFHRSGEAQPYVSPLQPYGAIPQYKDAEPLGTWNQKFDGVDLRIYGYTSNASMDELHTFYEKELPRADTLYAEKSECKMRLQGEGAPITIYIVENDTFRRVEISKPAEAP